MNIAQIKEKYTIIDYLGTPVKVVANGYLYRAPWREDKHPSLSVTLNGKGWHDLTTDEHGNLIDLVMKVLGTSDLAQVCAAFNGLNPSSSFPQPKSSDEGKEKRAAFTKFEVHPLQSRGLYAYLAQRGISGSIAKQLCTEAHYSFTDQSDKYLYALAFPNNKGGYELRSAFYKGGKAPKGISFSCDLDSAPFVVFEGFMDALAFFTLCGGIRHNWCVLNSVVNVDAAIRQLKMWPGYSVYLCLDNDSAGNDTTAKMLEHLPNAIDIRQRFAPHKDVNDYLLARCAKDS